MPSKDGATKKPWQFESSAKYCFLRSPSQLQPAYGLDCAYDPPFGRIPTDKTVTRKLTRYANLLFFGIRQTSPRSDQSLSSANNTGSTIAASMVRRRESEFCASSTASFPDPYAGSAER